ncbi:hypothetical protein BS47DRAFT_1299942 [Hydnum rufescens UP504]|uniref:Protein kinase domain-containing protein n=1 Tax=Hydnum rufescens UP504 TaxID=1448309 RepID=A0A9P6AS35_9AGAM|nr:hypothetical protein BS47DRAFT_1299942 [Hydnum rufescens UP504]
MCCLFLTPWESQLDHVLSEIIIHRQLKNRHILELLGVINTDQHPLTIITPWMENGQASKYLTTHPEKFMKVRGLCAAVQYLHCYDPPIVHGDIKPSNVLIDDRGEAVLSDFGFTRIRHEVTRTGTRSAAGGGTFRYLAPEIFSDELPRANVATDTYSLGLTIWELASSEPPFAHLNGYLVLARVSNGERPPKPEMIGTFDSQSKAGKAIWGLVEQMWSQDPKNRPPMKFVKEKIDLIDG